ncbi:DUF1294 domain-containing protein [Caulobacter sp. 602-2]|uniref:DUF1294 domain-containing protein n=1 Tax=Caulobacter sp. 602-2 TaxID=2710887 RepID=A0A6G4QY74_9CAUL|nr:DUF1294 domain-containing protein [Caulobacter sp. 602-2]NGM50417.1 DUF1294 domain-containing protein [Caulobacter sp. 602-2]
MILTLALLAANLFCFLLFAHDKAAAVHGERRVPERVLLLSAALCAAPGALLAQRWLRHKTRKQPFGAWLTLIVFAQACTVAGLGVLAYRAS